MSAEDKGEPTKAEIASSEEKEPPPRGVRTMSFVRWALVALSAAAAVWSWSSYVRGQQHEQQSAEHPARKYRCPMHPEVVTTEPGECPICHMTLVPFDDAQSRSDAGHAMTHVMSDGGVMTMSMGDEPSSAPPDTVPLTLSLDRIQSIGLRTSLVEQRTLDGLVRATAVVAAPEQTTSEVHVRTSGFVERMSVRETGVQVGAGQELFALYSPEAYQAETELTTARSFGDAGASSVEASRRRLELLGVSTRTIDDVVTAGVPSRTFPILAPSSGFVTKKSVVLGSYVTPEMTLYEIVDLHHVYVVADLFQPDVTNALMGANATFVPSGATTSFKAKVDLVYPQLDSQARTTRVRIQIANEKLELRPGQYGTVELTTATRTAVVVPRDAIVDTGKIAYVFVDAGGGTYTPRTVKLGGDVGDSIEVREGLAPGERVVSGATFLIDSESRLQASLRRSGGEATPSACDADFDRTKFPDKWSACQRCEQQHRGMGDMMQDCKNAIAKPWR